MRQPVPHPHAEGIGQKVVVLFLVAALGLFIASGIHSGKLKLVLGDTGWNVNAYKTMKQMGSRWGKLVKAGKVETDYGKRNHVLKSGTIIYVDNID